ncbi:iron-sulfur cluster assembly scaffold protein [Devosia sp. RR2S18]|uniref:iron-sulfur cluster assembly scaffold protein n=1 Tax=Devosia rhizosphaerae TaxID=3049774 RepID=UPI002540D2BB|nr:iron-sulfur cluster assembly scaffold protein [Devosia sp. RR2S18]WIJ27078.1 iron-sulfur cluster assembly scaffold protein [Devosia sp. RR2S18]
MELSDLYSEKILDLAANAPQPGRLAQPDASARKTSKVCGSVVEVDLVVREGVIVAYGHQVSACALGQTSAAVVAREIVGTSAAEFVALRNTVRTMLNEEGAPLPDGKWSDLRYLEPVRGYRARHASTMLVFDAVVAALEKIESAESVVAKS